MYKILIVSDTHGKPRNYINAVAKERPFDYLIHCGDIEGGRNEYESYAECETTFVSGNCDMFSKLPSEACVELGGHRIYVNHGHSLGVWNGPDMLIAKARAKGCDVAVYGHTHVPDIENRNGVMVINPGSLTLPRQLRRCPTYAVLEIRDDGSLYPEIKEMK